MDVTMSGMHVSTLRSKHDCTIGGLSSKHDTFTLVNPDVPEIFKADDSAPALRLVRRTIGGHLYLHAEPVFNPAPDAVGWMFGGNFIWSSDSRFPNPYPIAMHDRQETRISYQHLSD